MHCVFQRSADMNVNMYLSVAWRPDEYYCKMNKIIKVIINIYDQKRFLTIIVRNAQNKGISFVSRY